MKVYLCSLLLFLFAFSSSLFAEVIIKGSFTFPNAVLQNDTKAKKVSNVFYKNEKQNKEVYLQLVKEKKEGGIDVTEKIVNGSVLTFLHSDLPKTEILQNNSFNFKFAKLNPGKYYIALQGIDDGGLIFSNSGSRLPILQKIEGDPNNPQSSVKSFEILIESQETQLLINTGVLYWFPVF